MSSHPDDAPSSNTEHPGSPDPTINDLLVDNAEQQPKNRPKRALRVWLIVLGALVALVLVGAGSIFVYGVQTLNTIKREPGLLPSDRPTVPVEELVSQPLNFLVLGTDADYGMDRGRSDVMMLVHSDPSREKLYLISLPRDLWVPIPGHGTNKINAAYAFGGAPLAVKTVEKLLGVRIDNVALTSFNGFFQLIDDIGGVTVFNTNPSTNEGIRFPRGDVKLDGKSALAYVRQRKGLPRGDFDRAERQRLVMKAIVDKVASKQTLSDPGKLLGVIKTMSKSVTVDDSLTNKRILSLVQELQVTSGEDIEHLQVPVGGFGTSKAGASYVKLDKAGMAKLSDALNNGRMNDYGN